MADKQETTPKNPRAELAEKVRKLQSLTDYKERKAFYLANPELREVIDPCNFPD